MMASRKGLLKPINIQRVNSVTHEDEVEPLSPLARVFHAPEINCFIVTTFGFKTKIDVEVFKHGLNHTFVKHPRLSSKLVFDGEDPAKPISWVRTKVHIDDHIIVPDLDSNMDSPNQYVEDYVSNITKTSMDLSKPLWEFHILNVKTTNAASTGVFRIHHSIGDGVSIISLLLACTRKTSDPNAHPSLRNPPKKTNLPTSNQPWFLRYLFTLLLMFKVFWNTLVEVTLLLATVIGLKDTKTPLKGGIGIEKTPKRFVHRILSFDDIKLVKNSMGVRINDVALGIVQAGLSKYIHERSGEHKKAPEYNMFKGYRLRATLFVNLRPTTVIDLKDLADVNSTIGLYWGNKIGYILCPLDISLRDDPLGYIRHAKTMIDKKKQSLAAQFTYFISKLLLNTLGLQACVNVMHKALSNTTLSFSNVAGPTEEISFYGHPVVFFSPTIYGFPQALVVHFQSYMDKMALVLAVDEDVIPNPHKLCDEIEKSLTLAKDAVIEKFVKP